MRRALIVVVNNVVTPVIAHGHWRQRYAPDARNFANTPTLRGISL